VSLKPKLAAIILAAGRSSRMKDFKPLLPLGGKTVIDQVLDTFQQVNITDIIAVTGFRASELLPALLRRQLNYVVNDRYMDGMYSSVQAGVRVLPKDTDAFFLLPVDVPLVKPHSIRLLAREFIRYHADVTYPVFQQQRGHPPLVSARLIPQILAQNRMDGLQGLLAEQEQAARDVTVIDEGVLLDMDTPDDYRRISERLKNSGIPTRAECEAIFARMKTSADAITHGKKVAGLAGNIALALNRSGLDLNLSWVETAGMLHDMAKQKKNHARVGGRVLSSLGYGKVAESVSRHMDLVFLATSPLDETAVVYLADKLTQHDQYASLDDRFAIARAKYPPGHPLAPVIERRFSTAKTIGFAVEQRTGKLLSQLLPTDA
jgi:CTP:molybdopterin cytidylyltransferase MocA